MRTITVACRKRDEKVFTAQKYDNREDWNVVGGTAPSGVHATRYLRKITPDVDKLTPLARFLFENVRGSVAGSRYPHPKIDARTVCYNGRTEAEQIMYDAKTNFTCQCRRFENATGAVKLAESVLKCYAGFLDGPQKIDDWYFDIIEPNQTDDEYLNQEAARIAAAGSVRVTVGTAEWRA